MKSLQMLCTAFYAKSGPIFAFRVTLKTFFKCKKSTDMMNEIPFNTLISACFFFSQTQPLFSSSYVQGLSYKVYLVLEIRLIYISDRKTPKCVGVFKTSRLQKKRLTFNFEVPPMIYFIRFARVVASFFSCTKFFKETCTH